ncbi:MAG: histidine phosphatase family protein [Actinophytocola sp.]|uniref:SixA phosphatase family protein n=1 Tax=Actinophytocola sp. TaxID=1872138 RepID=UPI0013295E68|nr:histidine phosphatase family protein [Actinophytocola sp.]MPZ83019.1 histidine phosphatase family protein [Actinophytocola sp.]
MADQRTLVVIRHAKSDWGQGLPDDERPLNPRGRRDAPAIGKWLVDNTAGIDLVLCSTAARARQTWRLAEAALEPAPAVRHDERVYAAGPQDLMSVLDELADDIAAAALVGHNPGLSELVDVLTGRAVELKTSAIAVVRWDGTWADVWARRAVLITHATPRG